MAAPRKYASTTEAEIRALAAEGMSFVQMAQHLNVPLGALRVAASLMNIKSGRGQESHMPVQRWVNELAAGATLDELGKAHGRGVTRQSVHNALKRRGLPTNMRAAIKFKAASKEQATVTHLAECPTRNGTAAGSIPARGSKQTARA